MLVGAEVGTKETMLVGGPRQGERVLAPAGASHVADEDGCEYRIVGDVAILETLATDQEAPFRDAR